MDEYEVTKNNIRNSKTNAKSKFTMKYCVGLFAKLKFKGTLSNNNTFFVLLFRGNKIELIFN